jgi:hypothetical protein
MPFPRLPSSLTFEGRPELLIMKDKLEKGEVALDDVEAQIAKMASESREREEEVFSPAREFPSLRANDDFLMIPKIDSDQTTPPFTDDNNTVVVESGNRDAVEERISNIEHMLNTLMNQISDPNGFNRPRQDSMLRAPPVRPSLDTSGLSMISALSHPTNIADVEAGKQNNEKDMEDMRKEIENLKSQLTYAQSQSAYIGSLDDTTSASTGIKQQKKKRKRILKKPWK